MKKVIIPNKINSKFARILGYYLGDGSYEVDRISFSEQREDVAKYYQKLIGEVFGIDSILQFRNEKGYWQIRVYSRILSQLFKKIFQKKSKTLYEKIPSLILKSSNESLASFIGGFFDAEGYVSNGRVAFGINNKFIARQIQFSLLRLGIISSLSEYDNRSNPYSNKIRYTISIDDLESLKKFYSSIGFSSPEKQNKVKKLIGGRGSRNKVRQLVVNGLDIARIIRNSGLNTRDFHCGYFFCNKRQISKEIFKNKILNKIQNEELKRRLNLFYSSNLIAVKISEIKSIGIGKTIDIETKNHNFLANGIIVHNSSQRFHRITEGLTKEFYKRVAAEMKNLFFDMPKLKGILVGGPVPTKDEFLDGEYLTAKLRDKVIGKIDLGDTSESGLGELVGRADDILFEQEIIHEKKILEKFFETLGEKPDLVVYKEDLVRRALEQGAVEILIMSGDLEKKKMKEFKEMANNISSGIEIVSKDTEEGMQFHNLSGIGAILRYKMPHLK
jgi:stalled ribosome rescue protein Dom34